MMNVNKVGEDLSIEEYEMIYKDGSVAIDTETTGLNFKKDELCTIQLYSKNCMVLIRYDSTTKYTNLIKILEDLKVKKIFHNAVFDVSFLMKNLEINLINNIICTRISSKLVNGLKHNNSLKSLLEEYLNIDISKEFQISNWSVETLSQGQIDYAMNDVRYLNELWEKLKCKLEQEQLLSMAQKIFDFVPIYVLLQMKDIDNIFIY